ncbi:hypothetical protein H6G98_03695 [Nostoc sp. FACHB-857]|nr:hypothetical protein [Nostoc sp. FACHB-857]
MGGWGDREVWGVWGERFLPHPPTPPTLLNAPCPMPNTQCPTIENCDRPRNVETWQ